MPESDARRPARVVAKVVIRHEPAFFCSSLVESEPVEKVQIEAQKKLCVLFLFVFWSYIITDRIIWLKQAKTYA